MSSLIDRVKARMAAGPGQTGLGVAPPVVREKSRRIVQTNRFDDLAFQASRKTTKLGDLVHELYVGDEHQGGKRPEFEGAPEIVEAVFQMAYKAAPKLESKRRMARDLYPAHRIAQEIQNNPRLADLQQFTAGDKTLSVVATDAMGPVLKEFIERMSQVQPPGPVDPNAIDQQQGRGPQGGGGQQQGPPGGQPQPQNGPAGQGGQGGQQGQNPQQGGPGGQPGQPGQPGGQQPQGGGQPGQPDPNGQQGDPGQDGGQGGDPGNGPPPPPEEKDAEEGYGLEDEELVGEGGEYDPQAELDRQEADWERAFDEIMDDLGLDRMANRALEAAKRETEELENLRKDIGMEDGEWALMSPEERLALAEELRTSEMKDLAKIIGRMKRFALGIKHTRVIDVHHEAYNVEMGNDLRRILRPQFVLLATKATALEFYRRYADKELLQYKMRGTEDVGKGPIVMCIDKSGSMNGQPFHWALAVAESLRRFAADEDRDIHVLFFGNNNDRVRFEFPGGKAPFKKIMTFLGTIANGGTAFDGVLTEALQRATDAFDGEGKGKADIVFITDGVASLGDSWIDSFNEERARVGVRLFSVYIGGSSDFGHTSGPLGLLDRLSDVTIPVSELKPEDAQAIFARV